ncbi:MAG: putative DNA-binding transcriptional regulator YafY [Ilumatobacter sp.]
MANERWLARLLIRLGPDVVVLSPNDAAQQAADLAARMLTRY